MSGDPMEIMRRLCMERARCEGRKIDRQASDLLACGYELGELRLVYHREGLGYGPPEVLPESMMEE